tara:strand:+ start:681 stop:1325 length:645 start_codon:yes stop_codon:yes gene_type:complete
MAKSLLIDYSSFNISPQMIMESERKNNGRVIVSGVLQRAEAKNQNGRVYPKETLMREAKKYSEIQIAENRALGELDHPESSVVNLQNVSHNIKKIWWKGDDLMGTVEVLSTPSGNILKELLKAGVKLGISSRGMGSVEEIREGEGEGSLEVQPDFELVCWDFVSNPSTHGAFMAPVNESVNSLKVDKFEKVNNIINEMLCELTCKCSLPNRRNK